MDVLLFLNVILIAWITLVNGKYICIMFAINMGSHLVVVE